jgi:hypothetical protein
LSKPEPSTKILNNGSKCQQINIFTLENAKNSGLISSSNISKLKNSDANDAEYFYPKYNYYQYSFEDSKEKINKFLNY